MGGRIGFAIVAVLVIGAALYLYHSGAIGGVSGKFDLHSLLPNFASSSLHTAPVTDYVPPAAPPTGTFIGSAGATTSINPGDIPAGYTASQLSPHFHQVRFGGVSPASAYSYGQISLYDYSSAPSSSVDVTGWEIKTNNGGEYIPQAVDIYDPSGLAPASDIILTNSDVVNIYSTSAPVNLRLNECLGYLPVQSQFKPELPQNCPYIDPSQFQSFSGACQNYIRSLGSCGQPNLADPRIPAIRYWYQEQAT